MTNNRNEVVAMAAEYGFSSSIGPNGIDALRKEADDGSFWLISTPAGLHFDYARPDSEIWNVGRFLNKGDDEASITIIEMIPLTVALHEHANIPTPEFDKHGDPIEEEFTYWTDLHWRDRKGTQSWDKFDKVMRSIPAFSGIFDEGFTLTQTGGGCTAFEKADETGKTLWMIAADGGTSSHPQTASWAVQRELVNCDDSDNDGKLIGVSEDVPLAEVLNRYKNIPAPDETQTEFYMYFNTWEEFETSELVTGSGTLKP